MPRYKLTLEFDGTKYSGWQVQQNARTVQGMLITAAKTAFREVGEVMGSGRTDAGVHALAQVAHMDLRESIDAERVLYGLNDNLPADVNILSVSSVAQKFHARHDAVSRMYVYQISSRRTSFAKNYVWWIKDILDLGAMRRAATDVKGMHDFRAFAEKSIEDKSTKVLVDSLDIVECGELLLIRIRASHFLHKMVRRIVGTLVDVGRGNSPDTVIGDVLDGKRVELAQLTAPPSGLFLEQVLYPGDSPLMQIVPAVFSRQR